MTLQRVKIPMSGAMVELMGQVRSAASQPLVRPWAFAIFCTLQPSESTTPIRFVMCITGLFGMLKCNRRFAPGNGCLK